MKNTIFKNGILGGLVAAVVLVSMTFYMKSNPNQEPSPILGFVGIFFAFVTVVLGIKQLREKQNGHLTFGTAFRVGLAISFVISTMYVLVWLVVYYNFFPDFMQKYSEMILQNTKPEALASKTIEMNQMKEWYKNPIMIILLTYMEIFPIGIGVAVIAALALKKK